MSRVHLFDDFPPVSTEEWEEQIRQDLRGADYGETLLWHLTDDFTVRAYYREEDTAALEISEQEAVEVPLGWKLRQDIRTPNLEAAAGHARSAVASGVDILGIDLCIEGDRGNGVPLFAIEGFKHFLKDIPLSKIALHLIGGAFSPALFAFALDSMRADGSAVSLQFDPVAESAYRGSRLDDLFDMAADMIRHVSDDRLLNARVLAVDSAGFHNAGATPFQETALLLASMSEMLVQMVERGLRVEHVLERIIIGTPVGSSYFAEIARLRALRLLIRQLIDVFAPEAGAPMPPIHGVTSARNRTLFDPHENLLRSTTEAASAIAGGCDVVAVQPFDEVAGRYDEFSYRMARNVQHVLRLEAGFADVADPAAGSYYVEMLTDAFARRAWHLFQEIESEGGFFEALHNGFIHQRLETARAQRRKAFAERRLVLVGTNHYPNPNERRGNDMFEREADVDMHQRKGDKVRLRKFAELRASLAAGNGLNVLTSLLEGPSLAEPLPRERIAEPVEQRRLRAEGLDRDVRILLIPFGEPAIRSARANFAANFLGCGGFMIESPLGFDDVEAVVGAIRKDPPDVVVYCAPDDAYVDLIPQVYHQLGGLSISLLRGVVATPDLSNHLPIGLFDFAIHRGSNLIDVLDDVHGRLGFIVNQSEEVAR